MAVFSFESINLCMQKGELNLFNTHLTWVSFILFPSRLQVLEFVRQRVCESIECRMWTHSEYFEQENDQQILKAHMCDIVGSIWYSGR